jgi:hypothetical protein
MAEIHQEALSDTDFEIKNEGQNYKIDPGGGIHVGGGKVNGGDEGRCI